MSTRMKLTKIMNQAGRAGKRQPKASEVQLNTRKTWNIVRGDKVQVVDRKHPEFGKQGKILQVLRKQDRVIIEGVNLKPKRIKGNTDRGIKGRTVQKERSMPYSNVSLLDPIDNQPTKIFRKFLEDGTKVRVSKKTGAIIPRPEILTFRKRPISSFVTESCTPEDDVWQITYPLFQK